MNETTDSVNTWRQTHLFPPENVRIFCEVLTFTSSQKYTFSVQAIDEVEGTLIAAWTAPLRSWETFSQDLDAALLEFVTRCRTYTDPFLDA